MALTTRENVRQHLAIGDTASTWDRAIDAVIPRIDAIIKQYCQQNLERKTYTEYHSGANQRHVVLRELPVVSITNLWEDSDGYFGKGTSPFASGDLLTHGTDYVLEFDDADQFGSAMSRSGRVVRIQDRGWPLGYGNIKVSYTAGWDVLPHDIVEAATLVASEIVDSVRQASVTGSGGSESKIVEERLGDYVVRYEGVKTGGATARVALKGLSEKAAGMLERYRAIRL